MCIDCYIHVFGAPKLVNENTIHVASMIGVVYRLPGGLAGGNLHIVVDDWNLEDGHVDFCLDCVKSKMRTHGLTQKLLAEHRCATALRAMNIEERASALAIHDGYLRLQG